MKSKYLAVFFLLSINVFSQSNNNLINKPFRFGVLSGINLERTSEIGGAILVEGRANILQNLDLKINIGYSKSFEVDRYSINTFNERIRNDELVYSALSYEILKKDYDIFPLSIGGIYSISTNLFSPYTLFEVSYNVITRKFIQTPGSVYTYRKLEDIPAEFKPHHSFNHPENFVAFSIGAGTTYRISQGLELDFRYLYKFNEEILNTHYILFGICI